IRSPSSRVTGFSTKRSVVRSNGMAHLPNRKSFGEMRDVDFRSSLPRPYGSAYASVKITKQRKARSETLRLFVYLKSTCTVSALVRIYVASCLELIWLASLPPQSFHHHTDQCIRGDICSKRRIETNGVMGADKS